MTDDLYPGADPAESRPGHVDVLVVGAGISGLAAAKALILGGMRVAVLEARSRTGGRLLSTPLDLGTTWFWDGESRVLDLASQLGVATYPQHLAGDTIIEDLHGVQRYAGNLIDVPAHRYGGGASAMTDALYGALPSGTVHLSHPVTQIAYNPSDRAWGGMRVTSGARSWQSRHVVLALPPSLAIATIKLPSQLPAELVRLAAETPVWMGQVVKVVAYYDEPFWRHNGLAGAAVSRLGPLQEIHDMCGPGGKPAALFGFAHPATIGADAQDEIRQQFGRLFGPHGARPRQVTIQDWSAEPWTSPVSDLSPTGAGSLPAKNFGHSSYQRPALNGRLHWASTETSPAYPGHVEGALWAAERAFDAIHTELRQSRAYLVGMPSSTAHTENPGPRSSVPP